MNKAQERLKELEELQKRKVYPTDLQAEEQGILLGIEATKEEILKDVVDLGSIEKIKSALSQEIKSSLLEKLKAKARYMSMPAELAVTLSDIEAVMCE